MKLLTHYILPLIAIVLFAPLASAQEELRYSVGVNFHVNKSNLDLDYLNNKANLDALIKGMDKIKGDTAVKLGSILVVGGASPEGFIAINKRLSEQRAETLFRYLATRINLPDSLRKSTFLGRDWPGLIRLVEADTVMPDREETLKMLREIYYASLNDPRTENKSLLSLRSFKGGRPFNYMMDNMFPTLRASKVQLWYTVIDSRKDFDDDPEWVDPNFVMLPVAFGSYRPLQLPAVQVKKRPRDFSGPFIAIKTNMLFDAALIPNIGAEFYLGNQWSIGADWAYSWWNSDGASWWWRLYGGDIEVRHWLGKKAAEKPLQGHHLGVYGGIYTYDFEAGGKGIIGGRPGGSLWDKMHWTAGISYGYSIPVRHRLNIDFTIGLGYAAGQYWEYEPMDDHYVWKATKNRKYFGPTKAEISLVWLLGRNNYNIGKKGGRR